MVADCFPREDLLPTDRIIGSKFLREIAPKLDTDNAFVADAAPYTEQQLQFEVMNGDTDKVNSQAVVVLFLLVNVFLGLIGTFWFRTRRRRSVR